MSVYAKGTILLDAETLAAQKGLEAVAKSTDKVTKGLTDAEKRARAFSKTANTMGNALMVGAVAGGAFLASSVKLAARVETLGVVVNKLGENAGYTNAQMDKLTQGVVSQGITLRHARTAIAMMAQANIDLAQSSDLARLAQDAAVIANLDSSETFQRLIQVIQTGNIRMARHLGLVVDFQSAYMKFAKETGTTTDKLDQQQKAQIRVIEVMRAGTAITGTYEAAMETAGKKVLSLNRHTEESRRIIGELFLPAYADAVDQVTKFLKGIQALDEGQRASLSTTLAMATGFMALSGGVLKVVGALPALSAGLKVIGIQAGVATGGLTLLLGALAAIIAMGAGKLASDKANKVAVDELVQAAIREGKTIHQINALIEAEAEARGLNTQETLKASKAVEMGIPVIQEASDTMTLYTQAEIDASLASMLLAESMESSDKVMLRSAATMGLITESSGIFYGALEDLEGKAGDTSEEFSHMWEKAIPDGQAMIEGALEYIAFMNSEIPAIIEQIAAVDIAVQEKVITPEEAAPMYEALSGALGAEKVKMGTTAEEAATEIKDALSIGYNDAYDILQETILTPLDELDGRTVTVTVIQDIQTSIDQNLVDDMTKNASGGMLGPGVNLVGEQGPEIIVNGRVFDTATTMGLLSSGIFGSFEKHAVDLGGAGGALYDTPPVVPVSEEDWHSQMGDWPTIPSDTTTTTATSSAAAATSAAVTSSVATAITQTVEPALAAVAIAMPSSQEIAAGIQEATMAQVQATMKQNAEMLNELKQQTELLAEQGTADDMGRAVRDGVQSIV